MKYNCLSDGALLVVQGLRKYFYGSSGTSFKDIILRRRATIKAVDGIDLIIQRGQSFGIVGESGCGKSTLGKTILRLHEPTEGKIIFDGVDITRLKHKEMQRFRKRMQLVLQNPYSSLNPRKRVYQIIGDTLRFHGFADTKARTDRVLELVGLKKEYGERYPHEMSGGQRQRVAIARAISIEPELVVLDEVTSSLDVSIQGQIINLLLDLKEKLALSYLFISHDLAIVKHICDEIGVMYLGKIIEQGSTESIFSKPLHPYTQSLVSSIPSPEVDTNWKPILPKTEIESASSNQICGCKFNPRCPYVFDRCKVEEPMLTSAGADHPVSCHLYGSRGLEVQTEEHPMGE